MTAAAPRLAGLSQRRRLGLALFLVFQGLYLALASGQLRSLDEYGNHYLAESLWREHSTAVPRMDVAGRFYGRIGLDRRPYTPWGPGQPLIGAPYYAAVGSVLAKGFPLWGRLLANEMATSLVSTTAGAACVAVFFLVVTRLGASARSGALAAMILGTATLLATYSTEAFSEPLLSLLVIGAVGLLAVALETGSLRVFALGSAVAGYCFLTRFVPGGLLAGALVVGYLVERRCAVNWREVVALGLPFLLAVAVHLALNQWRFGAPLQFGHPDSNGVDRDLTTFDTPLATGLLGLLLSPGKSVFLFAPPLILALIGLPTLWRARPGATAAALAFAVAALLVYAGYTQWEGGYCFGPRYLMPTLPGLLLALPAVLERGPWMRSAAWVLAGAGAVVQLFGIGTSFVEAQQRRGYYDEAWAYRLAYSPLEHVAVFAHYVGTLGSEAALAEPIGLGLNSWAVVMIKVGASPWAIAGWLLIALALIAAGAAIATRAWSGAPPP